MAKPTPPLYGRFDFGKEITIEILIERFKQISEMFLNQTSFTAYLTSQEGKTFYGLDYAELQDLYIRKEGRIKLINASASTKSGKGVSFNIRFQPKTELGYGQFVITSGNQQTNEEIQEMIYGVWTPRPEPEYEPINLLDLLEGVKQKAQVIEAEVSSNALAKKIINLEEHFYFDSSISIYRILDVLTEISILYLEEAPFNIRLATTSGDYIVDMHREDLIDFFSIKKSTVLTLYVDAGTTDGYLVDIKLMFRPQNSPPTAKVEISAPDGDEIAELLSETLAVEGIPVPKKMALHTETFRFREEKFSIEILSSIIHAISSNYMRKAEPVLVLATKEGESYARLSLYQLQEAYSRHTGQVNVVSIAINQPLTHQNFNLMFQFKNEWREASGVITLMLGDSKLHTEVKAYIWERMSLRSYTEKMEAMYKTVEGQANGILINPIFEKRHFNPQPATCLICMPLEAYWSGTLWEHLKSTLGASGFTCLRSGSIYTVESLEPSWKALNEVDILIADMTYKNPDVFYKVGIAHTLGKEVIILTQHERDIPQDFRQFPHIVYNNDLPGLFRMAEELKALVNGISKKLG